MPRTAAVAPDQFTTFGELLKFLRRRAGLNQVTAAKRFAVPQPTLSKIVNGRVADLSLELLIRIAVRAGLPLARLGSCAGRFATDDPLS